MVLVLVNQSLACMCLWPEIAGTRSPIAHRKPGCKRLTKRKASTPAGSPAAAQGACRRLLGGGSCRGELHDARRHNTSARRKTRVGSLSAMETVGDLCRRSDTACGVDAVELFCGGRMRSGSHPRPPQMKTDLVLKPPALLPEKPVLHGCLPDDRREPGDLVILRAALTCHEGDLRHRQEAVAPFGQPVRRNAEVTGRQPPDSLRA